MAGKFHHEAIYRGPDALAKLAQARLVICGAGALGSNLAETLVRQGVARLRVIDHDRVEEHNIGTQTYGQSDIGQPKVDALRKHLFRATGVEVDAIRKELNAATTRALLKDCDIVVDCFDNTASRQAVQDHARQAKVATLHAGLFADYGEVIWDEQYRVPRNVAGDVCDYPLARNLVTLTVAIAAEAILRFVIAGERKNWSITLRDLSVSQLNDRSADGGPAV
ncbi:MAG TPA: ThiF family adenylyltransferase [Tepidisphaeraceae bacterium]|jgi:molybdopterin/thiamine biosynthesis adenylyltransferase|nr:ThiF family adenylyltransferase [Tepidisphaeraceae bacterium]